MAAVRILGIDPGTVVVGFACIEVEERARAPAAARLPLAQRARNVIQLGAAAGPCTLIEAGASRLGRRATIAARLCALADLIDDLLARLCPAELALEEAFCGKSVQSALRVGEARGVVLAGAHRRGVPVHQYPPARIKRAVAGSGTASKDAVARFVAMQLGIAELAGPRDVSDALATAFCRLEERRSTFAQSGASARLLSRGAIAHNAAAGATPTRVGPPGRVEQSGRHR